MISVMKFTAQNVNGKVVSRLKDEIEKTGDTEIDFKGSEILELVHKDIAELMISHGVKIYNVPELKDRDNIEYYRQLLLRPRIDNIRQYIEIFEKRFPVGTVCILNRTIVKGLALNEHRESIIRIEDILPNRVRVRKYHHSKVQPKYFKEAGGYNDPSLYSMVEFDFTDLYNDDIVIDHPRNEREREILDILFSIE